MTPVTVFGARQHNLRNITCSIPRGQFVVVTGPSGSGKSSLAFGTIYAEAQRRYAEALPRASRKHLPNLPRPDVDDITGLCPVVGMKQGPVSRSKRDTLGTFTEISDCLRRLFAFGSTARCPVGNHPIVRLSAAQIVERLLREPTGTKFSVLAPMLHDVAPNAVMATLTALNAQGFARVVLNGTTVLLGEVAGAELPEVNSLELVVDRIVLRPGIETRLADSVELALKEGASTLFVDFMDGSPVREFSTQLVCRTHRCTLPEPTPELFSFNHRAGACVACNGLGARFRLDKQRAIPNPQLSLRQGAIAPFGAVGSLAYATLVNQFVKHTGLNADVPWADLSLPKNVWDVLHEMLERDEADEASEGIGLTGQLSRAERDSFLHSVPCSVCSGARLGPHCAHFTLLDKTIAELSAAPLDGLSELVDAEVTRSQLLRPLWIALQTRLECLRRLGLGYLTLDTPLLQLSSGELQRVNLAQHVTGGLSGVMYVLDEPTASLAEGDAMRVIAELEQLVSEGNSLLVVEHNSRVWRTASHIIDMGPSAGALGGNIVAEGSAFELGSNPNSVTGPYLAGTKVLRRPRPRHATNTALLRFDGLSQGNLKNLSVEVPAGRLTSITGPSGSGKTTLLMRALLPHVRKQLLGSKSKPSRLDAQGGVTRVLTLDQSPIGNSPRSTLATYAGLLTPLRDLFAALPEARTRGFKAARFSYNAKGGRCETCNGEGVVRVAAEVFSELDAACPECLGTRYNRETLIPKFRGHSIADVLKLTVEQATPLFGNVPKLAALLRELARLGLGYVVLGQPALSLSGGEAQRIRLAMELSKAAPEPTLYLLDEPMLGLHPRDVELVLEALFALCEAEHTVVTVEHDSELVAQSDWVIELGPGAGPMGGELVYCGPAENR